MEEAGIPEEERKFKMKWETGLDIICHQQSLGVSFNYVGADGYYGNSIAFAEAIEAMHYIYMLDIHSNLTIYLEKSAIEIPPATNKRGRKPGKEKPITQGIKADKYMSELSESDWLHLEVRHTAKGKLRGDYHFRTVYIWDKEYHRMLRRLLVIRRTPDGKGDYEYKYCLPMPIWINTLNKVLLTCRHNAFLLSIVSKKTNRFLEWINIKRVNGWHGSIKLRLTFWCRLLFSKSVS